MQGAEIYDLVQSVFETIGINTDILKFNPETDDIESQPMYRLWHLLYSFEGDNSVSGIDRLVQKLKELYGFDPEYAKIIAKVTFEPDYGSISARAIQKILPFLMAGNQYIDACIYAGYNHSKRSLTKEQIAAKE